jgi:hypothetical protein
MAKTCRSYPYCKETFNGVAGDGGRMEDDSTFRPLSSSSVA